MLQQALPGLVEEQQAQHQQQQQQGSAAAAPLHSRSQQPPRASPSPPPHQALRQLPQAVLQPYFYAPPDPASPKEGPKPGRQQAAPAAAAAAGPGGPAQAAPGRVAPAAPTQPRPQLAAAAVPNAARAAQAGGGSSARAGQPVAAAEAPAALPAVEPPPTACFSGAPALVVKLQKALLQACDRGAAAGLSEELVGEWAALVPLQTQQQRVRCRAALRCALDACARIAPRLVHACLNPRPVEHAAQRGTTEADWQPF